MTPEEFSREAKRYVAIGKVEPAIKLMKIYVIEKQLGNTLINDVALLQSKYNELVRKEMRGVMRTSEGFIVKAQINASAITLIDQIMEEQQNPSPSFSTSGREQESSSTKDNAKIQGQGNIVFQNLPNAQINLGNNNTINTAPSNTSNAPSTQQKKTKILFLSANPQNETNPLRLDTEMRDVELELKRAKNRDDFSLIKRTAVRISDLQDLLLNESPNFIHFAGHGYEEGIVLYNNRTDEEQIVNSQALADLFELFAEDLECVFLNSCYSEEQAKLILEYVPHVIGMNEEIPDDTAIVFATTFYKGIGAGRSIGFSFKLAKNAIDLEDIDGSAIPVHLHNDKLK